MEITINLQVPEDFRSLCTIYNIQPQQFIQSFINKVSFPSYYTGTSKQMKWATLFFLQYTELMEQDSDTEFDLEDQYLQCFTDTLAENMEKHKDGGAKAREAGREVIRDWQKAVLAERARYITDQL